MSDDYSHYLANTPSQLDKLTSNLAAGKFKQAKAIAVTIRNNLDKVIEWADARIEKKPMAAPAAWPFPKPKGSE